MENWTDEDLYLELSKGDRERAFHVLYFRHSGPLFRFLYRFTLNASSAEEILQDIFEELLKSHLKASETLNLKSWLYTLAKNKSLNYLKKSKREINSEMDIENARDNSDLELSTENQNLLVRLKDLEKKLPEELSETWRLRKDGMDYQQIADQLSIPVGTVKSRFSRLVEFLKKEFVS